MVAYATANHRVGGKAKAEMGVVRIKATKRWHLKMAELNKDHKRLNREFKRAAERRELIAELKGDEARLLGERFPNDPLVQQAFKEIEWLEDYEAKRPRARDIALGRVRNDK